MKLYDKNLVIHNINLKSLAEYSTKTRDISYIYSDEGIFRIYDKNDLHSIAINDGKLDVLENYVNNHTFVIDHTIIKKQKPFVSHIPTNHVKMDYNINYYTLREKSNPNGDIKIKIIGLKKGEKLSEELALGNNLKKTKHPKIMLCDEEIKKENLNYKLNLLTNILNKKINIKKIKNILT